MKLHEKSVKAAISSGDLQKLSVGIKEHVDCTRGHPKVVVAFSGGRDSQACLILAIKKYSAEYVHALFNDTMHEHPDTYQHIRSVLKDLVEKGGGYTWGVTVDNITGAQIGVKELIRKHKRFPANTGRFCTDFLKMRSARYVYMWLSHKGLNTGFEVWLGIRGDEGSTRTAKYLKVPSYDRHKFHEVFTRAPMYLYYSYNVTLAFPLINIMAEERDAILEGHSINPLYAQGHDRVGCYPCYLVKPHNSDLYWMDPKIGAERFKLTQQLERETGQSWFKSCSQLASSSGCSFCEI